MSGEIDGPERDVLDDVRAALAGVADLPVEERPAVFERVNGAIVAELGAMEEV